MPHTQPMAILLAGGAAVAGVASWLAGGEEAEPEEDFPQIDVSDAESMYSGHLSNGMPSESSHHRPRVGRVPMAAAHAPRQANTRRDRHPERRPAKPAKAREMARGSGGTCEHKEATTSTKKHRRVVDPEKVLDDLVRASGKPAPAEQSDHSGDGSAELVPLPTPPPPTEPMDTSTSPNHAVHESAPKPEPSPLAEPGALGASQEEKPTPMEMDEPAEPTGTKSDKEKVTRRPGKVKKTEPVTWAKAARLKASVVNPDLAI